MAYSIISKEHYPPSSKARFFNLDLQSGGSLLTTAFSFLKSILRKPSVKILMKIARNQLFAWTTVVSLRTTFVSLRTTRVSLRTTFVRFAPRLRGGRLRERREHRDKRLF
jgi:hypothetical protein